MNPDLRNLVLDRMHHIVELQEHIYFDDPIMEGVQLCHFPGYIIHQFTVCIEVHSLDINVHSIPILNSEQYKKELYPKRKDRRSLAGSS